MLRSAAARCASENRNYTCEYDQCSPALTLFSDYLSHFQAVWQFESIDKGWRHVKAGGNCPYLLVYFFIFTSASGGDQRKHEVGIINVSKLFLLGVPSIFDQPVEMLINVHNMLQISPSSVVGQIFIHTKRWARFLTHLPISYPSVGKTIASSTQNAF